jgi:hypothetical protein
MSAPIHRQFALRLLLVLCVGMSASLLCAACGSRGKGASSTAQIPPAEEPPWTKEATLSADAGRNRDERPGPGSSTDTTNEER